MEWSVRRSRHAHARASKRTLLGLAIVALSLLLATVPAQADGSEEASRAEATTEEIHRTISSTTGEGEEGEDGVDEPTPHEDAYSAMQRLMARLGVQAEPAEPPSDVPTSHQEEQDEEEPADETRDADDETGSEADDEASGDEAAGSDGDDTEDDTSEDDDAGDPVRRVAETVPDTLQRAQDDVEVLVDDAGRLLDAPLPALSTRPDEAGPDAPAGPPAPTMHTQSAAPASEPAMPPLVAAGLLVAGGAVLTAAVTGGQTWTARLLPAGRRALGALLALPLFSKIERSDVLDHHLRAQVVDALRVEPGLTTQALRRRFAVGYSTLAHHVRILEQHGLVTDLREGRHRRLFLSGAVDRREHARTALLANPATLRVYEAVHRRPGCSLTTLAELTGVGANTVHWHLGRLAQVDLVTKRRVGRQLAVDPAPGAPSPPARA